MNAKNLIDDGYYEEVLLLTPDQVNDFVRNKEKLTTTTKQVGLGKGEGDAQFMQYEEQQGEYKGQNNYPSVEETPLLHKLKQFEGLGSDHVISRYYRYKQYERLLKDYFEKQIPLPDGFTVEHLVKEQRQIMKEYGKVFITLGIGHIPIDAARISNQQKDRRVIPRLPRLPNDGGGGGGGGGGDGGAGGGDGGAGGGDGGAGGGDGGAGGGNNLLRTIQHYIRRKPDLTPHRPRPAFSFSPYKSTPTSSKIPRPFSFQRSPYELRQRKQTGRGRNLDEIEEGEILYPIPIFDKKWKKVKSG